MLRKIIIQPKEIQQMSLFGAKLGIFSQMANYFDIYFESKLNTLKLFHKTDVIICFSCFVMVRILSLLEIFAKFVPYENHDILIKLNH